MNSTATSWRCKHHQPKVHLLYWCNLTAMETTCKGLSCQTLLRAKNVQWHCRPSWSDEHWIDTTWYCNYSSQTIVLLEIFTEQNFTVEHNLCISEIIWSCKLHRWAASKRIYTVYVKFLVPHKFCDFLRIPSNPRKLSSPILEYRILDTCETLDPRIVFVKCLEIAIRENCGPRQSGRIRYTTKIKCRKT